MANRTLNWDGTTNANATATNRIDQATGSAPATGPDAADNVRFGTGTGATNNPCTVTATAAAARSVDCTGYTGTLTIPASTAWSIGDATAGTGNIALKLVAGMTLTLGNAASSAITFVSSSATQQTITTAGKTVGAINLTGVGGSWILDGALTCSGNLTISSGTFNSGNYAITGSSFNYGNNLTRTITLGSSALTFAGGGTPFGGINPTNLTMTANTATMTVTTGLSLGLNLGSFNWNGLSFILNGGLPAITSSGATINNFTYTGTAAKTGSVTVTSSLIVTGTFTVNGNSSVNRALVSSATTGTSASINAAVTSFSNVDFMDITGAGAADWNLSSITGLSGDCGGNAGITFTTAATQTANGTTSFNWSDASRWTSRVPLPQDDVVINNSFSASQGIGVDMPRIGKNISITATGTGLSLGYASITSGSSSTNGIRFFGSFSSTVGHGTNNRTIMCAGRGTYTFASNGLQTPQIIVDAGTGVYTFTDDVTNLSSTTNPFTISSGTANTRNMTVFSIQQSGGTWNPGAYTITCTKDQTTIVTFSGGTFNGSAATITFSTASALTRTFTINSSTWALGTFDYSVAGSTGQVTFSQAQTVTVIGTIKGGPGRTLAFNANAVMLADTWDVAGTAGSPCTITCSHALPSVTTFIGRRYGRPVTFNYCTISRIVSAHPSGMYATNSTDGGTNTGITFSADPMNYIYRLQHAFVSAGTVTSIAATFPRTATAGNMLVAVLYGSNGPATATTPTGWTLQRLVQVSASTSVRFYTKISDGTETGITISTSSASQSLLINELAGFQGTPTVDVSDGNTSGSTNNFSTAGTNPSNTGVPALAIVGLSVNANPGVTVTPTNSFVQDNAYNGVSSVAYTFMKQLSTLAPVSTTLSWTTSRQSAIGLLVVKDVASANFLMFM